MDEGQEFADLRSLEHFIVDNTGKYFSEALILALASPQYDIRLFMELQVQYMKIANAEHGQNMLCT